MSELLNVRESWRQHDRTVVWTNGCFDLLHVGHVRFLAQARTLGDVLVVGVNSDASVKTIKGQERPLVPAEQRAEIVGALKAVDAVTIFSETTPNVVLKELKPDIHCKGGDYAESGVESLPETDTVRAYGGRIEILDLTFGASTSELIHRAKFEGRNL